MKVYLDKGTELAELKGQTLVVIGYGSQGRAQALSMRDSGVGVVVGVRRRGYSWKKAEGDGFRPHNPAGRSRRNRSTHSDTRHRATGRAQGGRAACCLRCDEIRCSRGAQTLTKQGRIGGSNDADGRASGRESRQGHPEDVWSGVA